ncbi:MAG: DUF4982 domain-containing protein [Halioglobus sp.]|nr:DUF4982 domain-containing protein [Halioglobus sp.]
MILFHRNRGQIGLITIFAILLAACSQESPEQSQLEGQRIIQPINQQWQFVLSETKTSGAIPDKKWQDVVLPHTWNAKDGQNGGDDYYRGKGIYRRDLQLDERYRNKKLYLHFDGAAINTEVYVNGQLAGTHKGSYGAFRFDITELATVGDNNYLEVHVTNEEDEHAAPLSADFTFFGGLYRQARLIATDRLHLDTMNYASSGVFWSQDSVDKQRAEIRMNTILFNELPTPRTVSVTALLTSKEGVVVGNKQHQITLNAGSSAPLELGIVVENPQLWHGLRDPYLYQATVTVTHDNQVLDSVSEHVGLRSFHVNADKGFFLNGEPYPLYGVNRMPDALNKGTALSTDDHERDIALILELGATSVRLGHQQRDAYVYRRTDEAGLVVWAEIPLINRIDSNPKFSENVRQQALELIRQNYNRASIVVWGLYNEITLKPGPNPRALVDELNALVKREDPGRLTTAAVAAEALLDDSLVTTPDLISYNRYDGWYYGDFPDFTHFLDHLRKKAPHLRVGISEYGAGASVHFQTDTPVMQDHSEQYQALYHEAYWEALAQRPWIWGKYIWVLADFAVDNRNEGDTPGRNDKGLVTFDRKIKKDAFYWYKANWSKTPMVHVTSRRHTQRNRGNVEIKVYSNQDEVELKVNGTSIGRQQRNALPVFRWEDVPLRMGENTIEAISTIGQISDKVTLKRVHSDDTTIRSSLLGVNVEAGKIYNTPHGATLEDLTLLLSLPPESRVEMVEEEKVTTLKAGMKIRIIAQDGNTSRDYELAVAPVSVAKPVWASAEIAADLSIGPIDIPTMSAAMANDGIIVEKSGGLTDVNLWNTMGGNKHWWKVDLGTDFYLQSIEVVWPQHSSLIEPGTMAYSVEIASDFKQTFDSFTETYKERVDGRKNTVQGTTHNQLDIVGRYIRVRLLKSSIFSDTPMVGKYPIYGAEEITIIGGLIYSKEFEIDYQQHRIVIPSGITVSEARTRLHPVAGGSLSFLDSSENVLQEQEEIVDGSLVIARDSGERLAEKYEVR